MHTRLRPRLLLAALFCGAMALSAALARAENAGPRPRRARRPGGVARDKGPAETRQERDARLRRECRGKPNSGACEGYGT